MQVKTQILFNIEKSLQVRFQIYRISIKNQDPNPRDTEAKMILVLIYLPYDVWIKSYSIICDRNPNGRLDN